MKRLKKITLFVLGPVILVGLGGVVPGFRPLAQSQAVVESANGHLLSFDVACDCRTFGPPLPPGKQESDRGDVFIVNGKIFPPGTLPSGTVANDPTEPVNGIAPIGDWSCRGQGAGMFPPAIAPSYSSTPFAWNTQYVLLGDGHALTGEGYDIANKGFLALTQGNRLKITGSML
jgi:hypothetical protein